MTSVDAKVDRLHAWLAEHPSALVAFSGGVDSTFLLAVAARALGERCVALTTVSRATPAHDRATATDMAGRLGVRHLIVETDELANPAYAANPTNRCYFCKDNLFALCTDHATRLGLQVIVDGANLDDLRDHRPGLTAAAERGIRHPLVECELTKADIRAASRALGLPTWDRPASPCLASRFPYGTPITAERLDRVGAAETVLRDLGFTELRVRFHDSVARIEVPPESFAALLAPATRDVVVRELRALGFAHITLDLQGFRSGSLNEGLAETTSAAPQNAVRADGMIPPARTVPLGTR